MQTIGRTLQTYGRTIVDGCPLTVWYDSHGYWHASAPGYGTMAYFTQQVAIRDAVSAWKHGGSPVASHSIVPPGWTEVPFATLTGGSIEPR